MKWICNMILAAMTLIVLSPVSAMAHLVTSGLGPFYDGALHLALSPDDLLGLVAVTLLAGLCGARAGRLTVIALPLSWFVAGLVGLNLPVTIDLPWLSILSFLVLGVLVAIDPKLHPKTVALLAAMFGTIHGLLNGAALAAIGAGPLALSGIAVTVLVTALLVSAFVVSMRAAWTRIAVRVAGSWVAAVGMLMFGWLMRGAG
jgi:hydrogenase/urease accessory protein HupE